MTNNQKFIIKLLLSITSIATFLYFLPKLSSLIFMMVLSILFFTIMDPLVDQFERYNLSRGLSAMIIIVLIFAVLGSGISSLIPVLNDARISTTDLFASGTLNAKLMQWHHVIQERFPYIPLPDDIPAKITPVITDFVQHELPGYVGKVVAGGASFFSSFFMIIFITFFLLKDERLIKKAIINLVPNRHFELSLNLMYKIQVQLASYLQGQFIAAMSVGILSSIGLLLLNTFLSAQISFAVVIGIWAGLANLIPYVGPVAGMIPAVLIVLFNQPDNLWVIIIAVCAVFMAVQLIDNTVVSPFVVGKSVNMHPLTVFLVLIIGGNLMGLIGMMFAVPVAGIIKVTITEFWANAFKYKT